MKILRSTFGVLAGWIVSIVVSSGIQLANFAYYTADWEEPFVARLQKIQEDKEATKAFIESLPTAAMVVLLFGWQAGAFLGGGMSALIAGRRPLLHAGIIGGLVLAFTILNVLDVKRDIGYSHPDWVLIAGLLSPIPFSLIAGKIVSLLFAPATVNPS